MKKQVGIAAVNKRMKNIIDVFGEDSEVYKKASHFFEANVEEKYLKKNEAGKIIGIKQTKEAKANTNLYGLHPEGLNEYVPSVKSLVLEERDYVQEQIALGNLIPHFDISLLDGTYNTIMSNRFVSDMLIGRVEDMFDDLNSHKQVVSDVYDVRDNKKHIDIKVYNAGDFNGRALKIIDDLHDKGRTREFIREARALIDDYEEADKEQKRRYIREKYGR